MAIFFDHEEIGSQSAYGADSLMLESAVRRIISESHKTSEVNQVIKIKTSCIDSI